MVKSKTLETDFEERPESEEKEEKILEDQTQKEIEVEKERNQESTQNEADEETTLKTEEETIEEEANLKDENGADVIYDVIYNSLLEWLLHKKPASIDSSSMIDDADKISSVNAILVMIKFYKHASEFVKQKVSNKN